MGVLDGRVSLVTGAANGLGRAVALLFANEGADVAAIDVDETRVESVATATRALGVRSLGLVVDVAKPLEVERGLQRVATELGGVEILVNNAGIYTTSDVLSMPVEMWDQMMETDLRSVFLCTRAVLPAMVRNNFGRIINISSQLAHKGQPSAAHYAAAKAGVLGFTKSVAYEVARFNVLVNAIAPGAIDTDTFRSQRSEYQKQKLADIPLGRAAKVDEIAATVLLLASEGGSYYVGSTLNPNGGEVMA